MSMWLAKPIYEMLPYLYMAVGVVLLVLSWLVTRPIWPTVFLIFGCISSVVGLILWLHRRDYRDIQARYNNRSLDE